MSTHETLCTHFGRCGGCVTQDMSYAEQLALKEKRIATLFANHPILPILPSPDCFGYRHKMDFSFSERGGVKAIGLVGKTDRGVIDIEQCGIGASWFMEVLRQVRLWWQSRSLRSYLGHINRGSLRSLMVRQGWATKQRMVVLIVSGNPGFELSDEDRQLLQETLTVPIDTLIIREQINERGVPTRWRQQVLSGVGYIEERMRGEGNRDYCFKIRPSSFFQPNVAFAQKFFERVRQLGELEHEELLIDLYCGAATFAILTGGLCRKMIGIELNGEAILDARDNLVANGVKHMELVEGDVGRLLDCNLKASTVVVDPPRAGLAPKAVEKLLTLLPKKILYISCNPYTQKRDVDLLIEGGYRVRVVQPGDQFPHTDHMENCVALELLI